VHHSMTHEFFYETGGVLPPTRLLLNLKITKLLVGLHIT